MATTLVLTKLRRRGLPVLSNIVNSLLVPLLNPLVALLVIRLGSPALWGDFVGVWVALQFGAHIVTWGNKEYLLRAFSRNPAQIAAAWQSSLVTRGALFAALCLAVSVLAGGPFQAAALLLWGLGLFLAQSCEALVQYRRAFLFAAAVEGGGTALLIGAVLLAGDGLNLDMLLWLYALISLVKAAVLLLRFRATVASPRNTAKDTQIRHHGASRSPLRSGFFRYDLRELARRFDQRYFGLALPFFLLGFSGLAQSKADLYAANYFLGRDDLAHYQVLTTLLTYGQAAANFVLMPFTKSLYRLKPGAMRKLSLRLALFGLALLLPILAASYLALRYLYQFDTSPALLAVGGLYILPIYAYLPMIYALFKANRPGTVIAVNVVGIIANAALSVALLPWFGLIGALSASAVAQWLMLGAYLFSDAVPSQPPPAPLAAEPAPPAEP